MKLKKSLLSIIILLILTSCIVLQKTETSQSTIEPPFLTNTNEVWVDSVFNTLTFDEKIAQLFMVAAYSNKDNAHVTHIDSLVSKYKIGGLIFMQGGPIREAILTNRYQAMSKVPLMIAIDGEWGLAMRLDSTPRFPRQMMLGAIQNNTLIYEMGREIANECREMGIHINFAPDIDINCNPKNPVINERSFGENRENVAIKGYNYMAGMQEKHVLPSAKHFPGHGDTNSDSHKTLPIINQTNERLDSLELYPFKQLINKGVGSIMVAHLYVPALDSTYNQASTLSHKIVTELLQDSLGFKGLIFTDALNMKGVSKYYKPGVVDVKALLAGNDILLFSEDVPTAIKEIKKAIENGEITQNYIEEKCIKILRAKYWMGLSNQRPIQLDGLTARINSKNSQLINRELVENALTLLKNEEDIIPIKNLDSTRIACVSVGDKETNDFQNTIDLYANVDFFNINHAAPKSHFDELTKKLEKYNTVIVGINNTTRSVSKNYGISVETVSFVENISNKTNVILDVFANAYSLKLFENATNLKSVLMSYEDSKNSQELSAQLIFGGIPALGKLPVSGSKWFKEGDGIIIDRKIRLKYSIPEELAINSITLNKIDSIAISGIREKAFPGCQILVAKDGVVFYHKSFGYQTYESKKYPIKNTDIYDLASVSKVVSTTVSLMKLLEDKTIDLNEKMSTYLPYLNNSNKKDIVIKDVLAHQAKLAGWIPFWQRTVKKGEYIAGIYSKNQTELYSTKVADSLFIRNDYKDSIFSNIIKSPLLDKKEYKYSDLGMILFYDMIEKLKNQKLNDYVASNFYAPLGAKTLGYKPLDQFERNRIVPTQNDILFRKQLVQGYVHDPAAAMFGGVSGHAGVFSNANDLAKLMQMLLQNGNYGDVQYLKKETVDLFTSCAFCQEGNRRGLGFDKPIPNNVGGPVCKSASNSSYGHTGFTGTMVWVDPVENLVYIFLSNRIYPDEENKKISSLNIRTNIQQVIYDAIKESKKTNQAECSN